MTRSAPHEGFDKPAPDGRPAALGLALAAAELALQALASPHRHVRDALRKAAAETLTAALRETRK